MAISNNNVYGVLLHVHSSSQYNIPSAVLLCHMLFYYVMYSLLYYHIGGIISKWERRQVDMDMEGGEVGTNVLLQDHNYTAATCIIIIIIMGACIHKAITCDCFCLPVELTSY